MSTQLSWYSSNNLREHVKMDGLKVRRVLAVTAYLVAELIVRWCVCSMMSYDTIVCANIYLVGEAWLFIYNDDQHACITRGSYHAVVSCCCTTKLQPILGDAAA